MDEFGGYLPDPGYETRPSSIALRIVMAALLVVAIVFGFIAMQPESAVTPAANPTPAAPTVATEEPANIATSAEPSLEPTAAGVSCSDFLDSVQPPEDLLTQMDAKPPTETRSTSERTFVYAVTNGTVRFAAHCGANAPKLPQGGSFDAHGVFFSEPYCANKPWKPTAKVPSAVWKAVGPAKGWFTIYAGGPDRRVCGGSQLTDLVYGTSYAGYDRVG